MPTVPGAQALAILRKHRRISDFEPGSVQGSQDVTDTLRAAREHTLDDQVDLDGFAILRKDFGKGICRDQGDTDLDRRVDLTGFGILKISLGNVCEAAVPEPSTSSLVLGGLLLLAPACLLLGRRSSN
jgi:hypothetical protein